MWSEYNGAVILMVYIVTEDDVSWETIIFYCILKYFHS